MRRRVIILSAALVLGGCMSSDFSQSVPAVLADDGTDYRPVLSKVISEALGGRRITLTPDTLKSDSRIMLEPKAEPMDPFGNPMSGRLLGKPDDFSLRTVNGQCVLLHEDKDIYYPLDGVNCRALSQPQKTHTINDVRVSWL